LRLIVFDSYQQLSPRAFNPDLPVRVVLIDEAALQRFGQWPWPRSVLADLTRRLSDLGATVIGFDFVMAETERTRTGGVVSQDPSASGELPSGDVALADAIGAAPVVLGFIGSNDSAALPMERAGFAFTGDDPTLFAPSFSGAITSLTALQQQSKGSGALNWVPEYDQVVRCLPLLVRIGDRLYPSLAAEALRVAQGASSYTVKASGASSEKTFGAKSGIVAVRVGEVEIPTDANGQMWLRLTASDRRRLVSAVRVFDDVVSRAEIEGRIVLVGVGAAGLSDFKTTPLEASTTGVELHAQAVEQMLLGSHLRRPDFASGLEISLLALFGAILSLVVYRYGALSSAGVGAIMLSATTAGSWYAYKNLGLLLDPAYLVAALTCLYLVTTVYRYLHTELERKRVRDTFGRYLTDEVVTAVLKSGLQMGGEKRKVTMMMTDLRGFTSLSERLAPEQVVAMLNGYLGAMTEVINRYRGTIDEFIGDAIFVLFGAPLQEDDDAERAVACALAMQLAMSGVNDNNRRDGLPDLEMGIGIHTGEVVVGNIGSAKRMKYGVVGSHVNLTARVQSHTTGGQVLVTAATQREITAALMTSKEISIKAKGMERPVPVCEVLGIGGRHTLQLPAADEALVPLAQEIAFQYEMVDGAQLIGGTSRGSIICLSSKGAEARLENEVPPFSNLKMRLMDARNEEIPGALYAKIVDTMAAGSFALRFTSVPPEISLFLLNVLTASQSRVGPDPAVPTGVEPVFQD
jgi:adenylate cyclase